MLCGRLAWFEGCVEHSQSLGPLVVRHYNENGDVHKMIFEGIKEQIAPQSLNTFQSITLQCLEYEYDDRPKANDVVIQLEKALRFQEDYEIWEHKLPIDYEEIIRMSKYSEINNSSSTTTKKDLYNMFSTGILLQDSKLLFSLGSNGERNELTSARMFTYKNRTSHKWQSDQESRFLKVAEIYYCGKSLIRVEGIEFRVINDVNTKLEQTLESISNMVQLVSLNEKKDFILSAKEVVYDSSNEKHFHLKPSTESRFEEVIEVQPRQVFRIKCKIQTNLSIFKQNIETKPSSIS
ncbi:hypothetical protein QVD17_14982 [Tagetes erecta]|uniref:Serine-threonine/tyrosine-protein kinase catalytic domain-containing protein n=1 Tax=Tagetes erecta TaxID=13708 RepID=A0AAD8KSC3_TARER|nr:hypothetical protein QVD17_14982 [Tagetes erecta]